MVTDAYEKASSRIPSKMCLNSHWKRVMYDYDLPITGELLMRHKYWDDTDSFTLPF